MLRVYIIRHAQTSWNQDRRIQGGNSDTILNDEGARQCQCLAERLKEEKVTAVYSSPLSRAMSTARVIADCHGLPVTAEPDLREIDCGTMEGVPITEIGKRLQQLVKMDKEGDFLFKACGGESLDELQKRAWGAILRMAEKHKDEKDGNIVVVTHYFVISAIICAVLNLPATQLGRFRIGETSVNIISFDERFGPFLSLFNDRCHLTAR